MKKAGLYFAAIFIAAIFTSFTVASPNASAACNEPTVLGFEPWYRCLTDGHGNVNPPSSQARDPSAGLQKFIWTIVLNLLDDFLRVVGWASVVYLIYGGFKYMMSQGSSDGMAKAKSTILNAIIGLVISVISIGIVNIAVGAFQ